MTSGRDGRSGSRGAAPETMEQALARARGHGRAAAAELASAVRALLDAAALATGHADARSSPALHSLAGLLDDLTSRLAGEGVLPSRLLATVAEALDVEIARWEERAREDADARAVLRAFLGLREVLWELGVRPGAESPGRDSGPSPRREEPAPRPRRSRRGVQRVRVEG